MNTSLRMQSVEGAELHSIEAGFDFGDAAVGYAIGNHVCGTAGSGLGVFDRRGRLDRS